MSLIDLTFNDAGALLPASFIAAASSGTPQVAPIGMPECEYANSTVNLLWVYFLARS